MLAQHEVDESTYLCPMNLLDQVKPLKSDQLNLKTAWCDGRTTLLIIVNPAGKA